jgi:hypothetical protein
MQGIPVSFIVEWEKRSVGTETFDDSLVVSSDRLVGGVTIKVVQIDNEQTFPHGYPAPEKP